MSSAVTAAVVIDVEAEQLDTPNTGFVRLLVRADDALDMADRIYELIGMEDAEDS